jgi:hypothetical protein
VKQRPGIRLLRVCRERAAVNPATQRESDPSSPAHQALNLPKSRPATLILMNLDWGISRFMVFNQ